MIDDKKIVSMVLSTLMEERINFMIWGFTGRKKHSIRSTRSQ
jgi:hypothetical protein